jgi:hypothetical protein
MRKLFGIIRNGVDYLLTIGAILVVVFLVFSVIAYIANYRPRLIYGPGAERSYKILPHLVEVVANIFLKPTVAESTTQKVTATFYVSENLPKPFVEQLKKGGMAARINKAETMLVRAELLAPGVEISGEAKQEKPLDGEAIPFEWQCRFKEKGAYQVLVRFAVVDSTGVVTPVGAVKRHVEVTTPGGISSRWISVGGVMAAVVAFVVGVLNIIGFFKKKEKGVAPAHSPSAEAPAPQPINNAPTPPIEVSEPAKALLPGSGEGGEGH